MGDFTGLDSVDVYAYSILLIDLSIAVDDDLRTPLFDRVGRKC